MTDQARPSGELEDQIAHWRQQLLERPGVVPADADELEDHLRGQLTDLVRLGLTWEEALMIAVRRIGSQHAIAADLAREHSGRIWKQHVDDQEDSPPSHGGLLPMLGFAVLAGLAVRVPLALASDSVGQPYGLQLAAILGVATVMAAYLAWLRRPPVIPTLLGVAVLIAVIALTQAVYPFAEPRDSQELALIHAPIAVGVALGATYLGKAWTVLDRWLDYIRFLGEMFVYYLLIALGGGALIGLTFGVFHLVGLDVQRVVEDWVLPLGIGGAVIVAAWLVEAKKSVIENMAPVLARVFTPLFTLLLGAFLVALLIRGQPGEQDRLVLIVTDLVLVAVLALLMFALSARLPGQPPGWFDWLQLVLVCAALVIDAVVLFAITSRIGDAGATPNRLAALGENLVLAANLGWSAWLYLGFLRGARPFAALERWQCRYLPVIGGWAAVVVLLFPPLFGYR